MLVPTARDNAKAARLKAGDIADYFLNISRTIAEAADIIERGDHPSGACASLQKFSEELPVILGTSGIMPKKEADEYARQLEDASNLEHSADNVSPKERQEMVDVLRAASGTFHAIGYEIFARR